MRVPYLLFNDWHPNMGFMPLKKDAKGEKPFIIWGSKVFSVSKASSNGNGVIVKHHNWPYVFGPTLELINYSRVCFWLSIWARPRWGPISGSKFGGP